MSYSKSVMKPSSSRPSKSTSSSVLKTITEARRDDKCILCNRCTIDELNLGPLYTRDGVTCHYYCLLFCCNIRQNGPEDTDGILGFLPKDVRKEVKRVTTTSKNYKYKCHFCKKPGATIGCFAKKCGVFYHFPCGLKNGVKFRFTSTFDSYCQAHAGPEVFKPIILRECPVCTESLEKRNIVFGRCCSNSNFHKECIQTFALKAGIHHLKCPICANRDLFLPDIQTQGIFVPIKDADWETDNMAFHELRQKYSRCDALVCLCPSGRDRNDRYNWSIWHLLRCSSCAASAIHVSCAGSVNLVDSDFVLTKWMCPICLDVDRRLQEKSHKPSPIPSHVRVGGNTSTSASDDESSVYSSSSGESLFTAVIIRKKILKPNHQTEVEENDDNSSVSSGGTLFAVVPVLEQTSNINSQQEMDLSPPPPDIDQPTATSAVAMEPIRIQDIKIENEDAEETQRLIPFLSFYGENFENEDDLSTHVSSSDDELETQSCPPAFGIYKRSVAEATMQHINNEDNEFSRIPDPVLSFPGCSVDEDDLSTKCGSSSESDQEDMEVLFPVEPQRKRMRRIVDEVIDLPAFKINEIESDDNDRKQVRCYCERYWDDDDEVLIQCLRCSVFLHKNCRDGIYKIYGQSLQTRCCQECTELPALKKVQEIPLSGKYTAKGCEKKKGKTYYLTLINKAKHLMVRRHDAVYVSERNNQDLESSRILRVEKLWKDTRGTRYISGHYYYRPSETANATTRKFYRKEIFRSTTATEDAIKMENVLGRCWILDPVTYCKGRPTDTTLDDEKHVFICESWVDSRTNRISILKLAKSLHSICMTPDAFNEFVSEMKIKKDYRVEGLTRAAIYSSFEDHSIVDLDSD